MFVKHLRELHGGCVSEKPMPGPTDYASDPTPVEQTAPSFSFRGATKPVYPDVLHYKQVCTYPPQHL